MPKFYRIQLESGKEIFINPDHIMAAEYKNDSQPEIQLTMDNGFILNFYLGSKQTGYYDNGLLNDLIRKRPI